MKKNNLKAISLYEYLKHQNNHSLDTPFFLADNNTYKNAYVKFPFRTFTYGIGITYTGGIDDVKIGNVDYKVHPGCLTTIGPGIVCTWSSNYSAEHDTVYFTEELFNGYSSSLFLQSLDFFSHGGRHVIPLTEEQIRKVTALIRTLKELQEDRSVIPGIVHSLIMFANSIHAGMDDKNQTQANSTKERIAAQFRKLVAEQYREHKAVAFYASSLNITPDYLSEVLQCQLGKSAKKFIDEFVAFEAKSLLKQTPLSIQEICYFLGYEDASSFTKIFKKQTGTTPSSYRVA
ncbi:helix-turn-helix domain-containing protein [Algoriphagus terrigena]|uniref:helix-turn-helix domain-containing protein n=1 Tax=Algoriphagus terrigena TaxID=344884 RepID=UPI00040B2B28|nr:AraC family transcriptional regulator [Algoriphagus terrigena]